MDLSRRSFAKLLGIAAVGTPALLRAAQAGVLADREARKAIEELQIQIGPCEWRNGVPNFTGFKCAQVSNEVAGQVLLSWNPLLPIGHQIGGVARAEHANGRSMPHAFFFSNIVFYREELDGVAVIVNQSILEKRVDSALHTLAAVVRKHPNSRHPRTGKIWRYWLPIDERPTERMLEKLVSRETNESICKRALETMPLGVGRLR